jgi:D-alanyl-lipoteichoic acid acyltransferase DltB (MBOAT superfamily)
MTGTGERCLRQRLQSAYQAWVDDYRVYARMRGFTTELNDWPYVRRSFLECWAEPGFHRFWEVWNPGISYFVYRLYLRLGGQKRRDTATLIAFIVCGLAHDLIAWPFVWRWSWVVPTAFLFFGVLTVTSRRFESWLRQDRWPWLVNLAINLSLVILGFDLGFRLN